MPELFKTYTLDEIVVFIILLALAIKSIIDLYDWFIARFKKPIDKANNEKQKELDMLDTLNSHEEQILGCKECLNKILTTTSILMESDKDDIKA